MDHIQICNIDAAIGAWQFKRFAKNIRKRLSRKKQLDDLLPSLLSDLILLPANNHPKKALNT
jgi:dTDP-4-amino-4,6-dideoxygalactose transaminase